MSHFEMPRALTGEEVLALAHETLVERSCTYIDSLRQVGPEYEVPVGDLWETHTDPETGRTLVNGSEEDYWGLTLFVGAEEEVDESWVDGILEPVGLSVESIAAEVIARRCEETDVDDPEARAETLWAVRRAVARTLTDEDENGRTLRQLLSIARARGEEVFDRAYGLVRMRRAGVYLDQHPEWRSLQAFFEAGFRPPTHQRRRTSSPYGSASGTGRTRIRQPSPPGGERRKIASLRRSDPETRQISETTRPSARRM